MSKIASLSTPGIPKENLIKYSSPWSEIGVMILSTSDGVNDDDDNGDSDDNGDGGDEI